MSKQFNINGNFFKAPSVVPELKIKQNWNSDIEISWEEIPLEQRNGFIKGYKVFYWEENGPVKGKLKA